MPRKTVEILNPTGLDFDEEEWCPSDERGDYKYYRREKWDLKIILTERFNPQIGDVLHFKSSGAEVTVKGIDGENLWVKSAGAGYYTTLRSQFKEYDA